MGTKNRACQREGCPYEGVPISEQTCPDCGQPTKPLGTSVRADICVCRTQGCSREGMATNRSACPDCGKLTAPFEDGRWP